MAFNALDLNSAYAAGLFTLRYLRVVKAIIESFGADVEISGSGQADGSFSVSVSPDKEYFTFDCDDMHVNATSAESFLLQESWVISPALVKQELGVDWERPA